LSLQANRSKGRAEWDSLSLMPIQRGGYAVYPEATGIVWIGNEEGLYRYDGTQMAMHPSYPALIREVRLRVNDSLVYVGGYGAPRPGILKTPLPFKYRDVSFRFAATSYVGESGNEFQCRLEGSDLMAADVGWSKWSRDTRKDYTNLPPGHYIFHVRAVNPYGEPSRESTFTFDILPPWYRTMWAYLLYVVVACLVIFGP